MPDYAGNIFCIFWSATTTLGQASLKKCSIAAWREGLFLVFVGFLVIISRRRWTHFSYCHSYVLYGTMSHQAI